MTITGKTIAVTRAATQAGKLRKKLLEQGAFVLEFPLIRFQQPADTTALDHALRSISTYDWLVFTSVNGVEHFFAAFARAGLSITSIRARIAVVGTATAAALSAYGLQPDIVPTDSRAEGVLAEMLACGVQGSRVLLARAAAGRSELPDGLRAAGAIVDVAAVYETAPDTEGAERLCAALQAGLIDVVTFASSSTVQSFLACAGERAGTLTERTLIACIGPVTAATAREAGLRVDVVANQQSTTGLVEALHSAFSN